MTKEAAESARSSRGEIAFGILGPLEVRIGGRVVALGGAKQRAVLAMLLLRANEIVSSDRLIAGLWGESPPETASTALHGYVSQLRKLLEPMREARTSGTLLETRAPGYALRVEEGQLDLQRFEQLVASARRDLAEARPERASVALAEALGLWRGAPLSDLARQPFADLEVRLLEELRLAAQEDRLESDLALGRQHELIPELEALIRQHPLRERLHEQLILALYRAGRQADALQAYADTRRLLVEELGIEPRRSLKSLERAILVQDPALDIAPPSAEPAHSERAPQWINGRARLGQPAASRPRLRRRRSVIVVACALAALAVLALRTALGGTPTSQADAVPGNSVALVDPDGDGVVSRVAVGHHPTSISASEGAVWVLNGDDQTISRIDEATGRVKTFAIGATPTELVAGAGAVWVGVDGGRAVVRLDRDSGVVDRTIRLAGEAFGGSGASSGGSTIAVGEQAVWVVNPDRTVSRIDPERNRVVATVRSSGANTIALGDRAVWVVNLDSSLTQIDPATNRVRATIEIPANSLTGVAVGAGSVWATDPIDGLVWRVDTRGGRLAMRTIPLEFGATGIVFGKGAVWVSNGVQGTLTRIDPRTNRVSRRISLANAAQSVTVGAEGIWVSVGGSRAAVAAGTTDALPQPPCGRVVYEGAGEPRFLIASDLPLQGGSRANALSMIEAIELVLRAHAFKAGRFTVGYQFCDDATAQAGGFEYEKCAANASAYVAHRRVLGLIGSYNSGCSLVQIPIANRASLAMISPSNSAIGLTHAAASSPRGELARLYPTGERNYARIFPADDVQAAASALLARRLGCARISILQERYGGDAIDVATSFARAARRLGLTVFGPTRWDPAATSYAPLARSTGRVGASCVFLAGGLHSNGGRLLRDLRLTLGQEMAIIASDGFSRVSDVVAAAGAAADGLYVSLPGVPTDRLGPAGQRFIERLSGTRPAGEEPSLYWGTYAAQAAELLLDAIASSDGTRASVRKNLLETRVENGILGSFGFDENGDVEPGSITILRVRAGGEGMFRGTPDFADGAIVDRVLTPPARLVRGD
ncbi:MAG: ABC transporter substrate-binding protein [Actinobacteria bacterium]|nr:ABC transporter substrate-binding protein [Actinomycetota bacterium]